MDYVQPVEAIIPGVQGRILGVLARTDAELTMRTVARLAAVSPNRATTVLNGLVRLGVVERRDVGTAALVRLVRENEAGRIVLALGGLLTAALEHIRNTAKEITPPPTSLTIFGSFARGQAGTDSDLDALIVRPEHVSADDVAWTNTVGKWSDLASRVTGNPVNLVVVSQTEIPDLAKRPGSVWSEIMRDGVTLLGADIRILASVG